MASPRRINTEAVARAPTYAAPASTLRQRIVVVVEDDVDTRAGLQDVLEQHGYQVFATGDGQAALDRLRQLPRADLLILDLYMPGLSGFEIYQAVRDDAQLSSTPIIVVTAAPPTRRTGLQVAATIRKPIEVFELLFVVGKAVAAEPST